MTKLYEVALGVWHRVTEAQIGLIAAGIGFFGFLAIFPALAAVITIWGFAANPVVVQTQLALAEGYLPPEAYDLLSGQVGRILATNSRSLGITTLLSTVFALWSARAGVSALITGLNTIYRLPGRSGLRHVLRAFVLTLVLVGLVLAGMTLAVVVPVVLGFFDLGKATEIALSTANFLVGMLFVMVSIALAYRLGPNRAQGTTRPPFFTVGLFLAIGLWVTVSRGLVFYLTDFANYNQVYGSIGAVVALLMWFYLSAFAVLLGAAINAELEARKAQ
ncbi:YihY/virulence factor BrkB family protein [Pseudorhodobacter turbinis]|uniref:YihY/virulence factor BrkB family protein n=1 Tax=Pseudorhodobacter turbinis TaxID=2500533 RepID=A0A4P8EF45_9RHOB|nr:YihY/virulence factor BrkB family protein [Pseudorhodobacter turbinis]QCO55312.1 YihY/virulence factor BrkB family protein [Pseudorhodobacter turbinis]